MQHQVIYLDSNSTTKIDPRVLESMMPFLTDEYGNASSGHKFGIKINRSIQQARTHISDLINCEQNELIFTSGATESINLALKGVVESQRKKGNHIVTFQTEHSAVLDTCKYLESIGCEISYLPVKENGLIDFELLINSVRKDTIMISMMLVNNETGVIQPFEKVAEFCNSKGLYFMTDATQAIGKLKIDLQETPIDLMAFSGHKFYAPKGIGALYVRKKSQLKLIPIIHGGGHENGFRSGTLNVPAIVGFGKAAELSMNEMESDRKIIEEIRDRLENELLRIENSTVNGSINDRLYNVTNICFKGIEADAVILGLNNISVSNGSACTSNLIQPSHVLKAMGLSDQDAFSSIRFSIGRFNSLLELEYVIAEINSVVKKLRAFA